jgi:hypothetical protein
MFPAKTNRNADVAGHQRPYVRVRGDCHPRKIQDQRWQIAGDIRTFLPVKQLVDQAKAVNNARCDVAGSPAENDRRGGVWLQ